MNEILRGADLKTGAGSMPERDPVDRAPSPPARFSEQARLTELETENARLLRLVGELLVANQQLRERTAQ
jgi:hypothetical protein